VRIAESVPITVLEPEPAAESLPLSSNPQSAIRNPQSEEELTWEEAAAILAEKPQMALLATIVETLTSGMDGESAPKKARFAPPSKPSKEDQRKARRQREKAARKRARGH
jgi:hypothetical protein